MVRSQQRSRSPRRTDDMVQWAASRETPNEAFVRRTVDSLNIVQHEKGDIMFAIQIPKGEIAQKLEAELACKGFPKKVIKSIVEGIDKVSNYKKRDSFFGLQQDPQGWRKYVPSAQSENESYHYAVWLNEVNDDNVAVNLWAIKSKLKRRQAEPMSTSQINGLKQFMELQTREDVLQIMNLEADSGDQHRRSLMGSLQAVMNRVTGCEHSGSHLETFTAAPQQHLVSYAKAVNLKTRKIEDQEDMINRMGISNLKKHSASFSFEIDQSAVVGKVEAELRAKEFPEEVVKAVCKSLDKCTTYKKKDEDLKVKDDNTNEFHRFVVWSKMGDNGKVRLSMLCVAAKFKKTTTNAMTKDELDAIGSYLASDACDEVLNFHCTEPWPAQASSSR